MGSIGVHRRVGIHPCTGTVVGGNKKGEGIPAEYWDETGILYTSYDGPK